MKGKLGWIIAIGVWMISLVVVMGSLMLSLTEGGLRRPSVSSNDQPLETSPAEPIAATELALESPPTATATPLPTMTATVTETPTPTCAYPAGWVEMVFTAETSLDSLALQYGLSPQEILQANCLSVDMLSAANAIYLPPATITPTATPTEKPRKPKATEESGGAKCGAPAHWVVYVVQKGDTLYSIGVQTGASIAELQWANCLGNSTQVRVGQKLYVPRLPQGKPPTPTPKPPKPTKPPVTSAPAVTPIVITPKPTDSP